MFNKYTERLNKKQWLGYANLCKIEVITSFLPCAFVIFNFTFLYLVDIQTHNKRMLFRMILVVSEKIEKFKFYLTFIVGPFLLATRRPLQKLYWESTLL